MEDVFTDGKLSKDKIISAINYSKESIKIAMAYFTDVEIASVLITARSRGVKVTVIVSSESTNDKVFELLNTKCEVYKYHFEGRGIMHHKFCIVDKSLLLHGSYNYTYNAMKNNEEALNITDSSKLIQEYNSIFEQLLKEVNLKYKMEDNNFETITRELNYADKFYNELKGHVQHILDFDKEKLINDGKEISLQTNYAESGFLNKLDSILSEVQTQINKDDQTKELIKIRMKTSLDNAISLNNNVSEKNIELLNQKFDNDKSLILEKIETEKSRKNQKLEELNSIKLNYEIKTNEISNLNNQKNSLDIDLITEPFWNLQGFLGVFFLIILSTYLSFYIGSAFWKIFFESNEIKKLTLAGIIPENPAIFDANALIKLFVKKGFIYGVLGSIFFMIPLFLTILKLFPKVPKYLIIIGKVIGLVVIDIIVSLLISQHTFDLNNLLMGVSAKWDLSIAIQSADFWLIFILGSIPFFITSILIEQLWISYKNSQPKYINREKNILRKQLEELVLSKKAELIGINSQIENLNNEIKDKSDIIKDLEDSLQSFKEDLNNKINEIKLETADKKHRLNEIYNGFLSKVDSGTVILEDVINGRVIAFKEGFFEPITSTYLPEIAKEKISSLENIYENWKTQNFR